MRKSHSMDSLLLSKSTTTKVCLPFHLDLCPNSYITFKLRNKKQLNLWKNKYFEINCFGRQNKNKYFGNSYYNIHLSLATSTDSLLTTRIVTVKKIFLEERI